MIGRSSAFSDLLTVLKRIAVYDVPVLIEGETGTGKELAARAIHYDSRRRSGPFVPVNCGALPDSLIENELFGHCRGAYTDARGAQVGLVQLAHGGTLFLDEVDTLSPKGQVTLLRFLQDFNYRPLGGRKAEQADVRVIAACNVELERLATEKLFRSDLLYRLKIMHVRVPPLRERHGDAELLAAHFVSVGSAQHNKARRAFDPETLAWFGRYEWPGNIRELENLVCREFLLRDTPLIRIAAPVACRDENRLAELSYREAKARAVAAFEARYLTDLMQRAHGSVSLAARMARTERRHLGRLLKKRQLTQAS
jgi:two-component system, NtrC family, response regulator GlrR